MGAFTSALGLATGGASKLVPSASSQNTSPQNGLTGNTVLNFGGINLGNQDIPLNAATTSSSNQPATTGNIPAVASAVTELSAYLPYILLIGAGIALFMYVRKR